MNLLLMMLIVFISQLVVTSYFIGISWIIVILWGMSLGTIVGIVCFVAYREINLFIEDLSKIDVTGKSVFITGCDSGFGLALAESLVKRGMFVFAGVLNMASDGARNLQPLSLVKLIKIDVVNDKDVEEAQQVVKEHLSKNGKILHAVVNNAGIGYCKLLEFSDIDKTRQLLEVNALGMLRVSKEFIPLLRGHGRIINMTSLAGILVCPFVGMYSCSKFAAEAISRTLRMELHPVGIPVITIQPGFYKTTILSVFKSIYGQKEETIYGTQYMTKCQQIMDEKVGMANSNLAEVISCMESGILNKKFQYYYNPNFLLRVLVLILNCIDLTSLVCNKYFAIIPYIPPSLGAT